MPDCYKTYQVDVYDLSFVVEVKITVYTDREDIERFNGWDGGFEYLERRLITPKDETEVSTLFDDLDTVMSDMNGQVMKMYKRDYEDGELLSSVLL